MPIENGNSSEPVVRPGGFLFQKPCGARSLRAKLWVFLALSALIIISLYGLYPFLAVNDPVPGGIIAIEGWIHEIDVERTIGRLDPTYERNVFIVSSIHASGPRRESGREHSEAIAAKLRQSGISAERLHMIFCEVSKKDRTYHAALALRDWIQERGIPAGALNVITTGPHARRSRLLFQKAFGPKVKVGVIPNIDPKESPPRWWHSPWGIGHMIYQSLAYMYAQFFFQPD